LTQIPVDAKSFLVMAHPIRHQSLQDLLRKKYLSNYGTSRSLTLTLDMSSKSKKSGGFKIAYFGTASVDLFNGNNKVCAKQAYYSKPVDTSTPSGSQVVQQKIPYDTKRQAKELANEVNCLVWAQALLDLVYAFVEQQQSGACGKPDFNIPQMRFVEGALAIAPQDVFLVEEAIVEETEGRFRKYINNNAARPIQGLAPEDNYRAEFLSFTQHVQYWKTKKLAFVTDYQGIFPTLTCGDSWHSTHIYKVATLSSLTLKSSRTSPFLLFINS
jgi:hypothetical protein